MIYKYGIDFGTTNSSIALRFLGEDGSEHLFVFDLKDTFPKETIPSVALIDDDGEIIAGEEAQYEYSQGAMYQNDRRYIKQIKLDLEQKGSSLEYKVVKNSVKGVDIIAAILAELKEKADEAVEDLDVKISGVVMGVPVQYGDIQKNVLMQALVKAGFYDTYEEADAKTEFVSEPIAVAVHYGIDLNKNSKVMVFDFGGGTLDLAIVNLKKQDPDDDIQPHEVIAKERLTLGGEELTKLFFINSFCSEQKYGLRELSRQFNINANIRPIDLWNAMLQNNDGIRFIEEIEKCKCELSHSLNYKFSFIGNNIQLDEMTFYRDDFEKAISNKLHEITTLVNKCLEDADIDDPSKIDRVILAGGSSLIPSVQAQLVDIFGPSKVSSKPLKKSPAGSKANGSKQKGVRVNESEVLTSIVRGLAIVGCRDEALVDDIADSDYGVWDAAYSKFVPIVEKGTPVKRTIVDKITKSGISEDFVCITPYAKSVEVKVYQRTDNQEYMLGTIIIPNPGGKKYRIFMQVNKKKGSLEVIFYDLVNERWIDDIPLEERTYTIN